MGGEGAIFEMNRRLKENREMLKARYDNRKNQSDVSYVDMEFEMPKGSEEGREAYIEKLRKENRSRSKKILIGAGVFTVVTMIIIYLSVS